MSDDGWRPGSKDKSKGREKGSEVGLFCFWFGSMMMRQCIQ